MLNFSKTLTKNFTFTQMDVVIMQYEIAFDYANVLMSEEKRKKVTDAIRNKKISAMGIYGYDNNRKRVVEVEIKIDWEKHEQIIQLYGDKFDSAQGGFNSKNGEAAETKIYMKKLKELATANNLTLACWVRLVSSLSESEYKKTLNEIGFNGGRPLPWRGDLEVNHKEAYGAISQMEIDIKATKI